LLHIEWQVDDGYENTAMAYPGYIIYEFDSLGRFIGPSALLQTLYDLTNRAAGLDDDILSSSRFTLDNQWNLYYLYYRSDSTEVWMVPRSQGTK
jgi:hypothetical protein